MGVDMHHADGPVLLLQGAQDRQRDGVIAAHGQRLAVVAEDLVVGRLDDVDALQQVEGVDRDIADIGDRQAVEGRRAGRHVVGADQAALGADLARAEPCAGAVGGSDVEGHADETGIEPLGRSAWIGRRIMVAGPPKRGIWLPPSGWWKVLVIVGLLLPRPSRSQGEVKHSLMGACRTMMPSAEAECYSEFAPTNWRRA